MQFWEGALGPFRLGTIMSFLVNKKQISYYRYFCHQIIEGEIRCSGRLSSCSLCVWVWWLNENPNLKKKPFKTFCLFFWRLGFFFKIGKKSPKFHWKWGRISAPLNTIYKSVTFQWFKESFMSIEYFVMLISLGFPTDNQLLKYEHSSLVLPNFIETKRSSIWTLPMEVCLFWFFTSKSTIFQSCRDRSSPN